MDKLDNQNDPWRVDLTRLPNETAATIIALASAVEAPKQYDTEPWLELKENNLRFYRRLERDYVSLARHDLDRAESLTRFLTSHGVAVLREFGGYAIKTIIEVSDALGRDIQPWLDLIRTQLEDADLNPDEYALYLMDRDLPDSFSAANRALIDDLSREAGYYDVG